MKQPQTPPQPQQPQTQRINKFIALNSQFSRRKADELIQTGKVFLNGKIVKELGLQIDPQKDRITIGNKTLIAGRTKVYFALNKPAGYICTRDDELKRPTVMELMPKIPNLKPVGRLDLDTEGLLLLSNDGDFINRHTHPKFECEKEYFIQIKDDLTEAEKTKLENGIRIEGKKTAPAKIHMLSPTTLRMTIHEGRKRQIRKMFDSLNHPVKYLKRIRIGNIHLASLKKGHYRPLSNRDINAN